MNININYNIKYEEQIKYINSTKSKPKLLLHACCAPCSSHVLSVLSEYFDITLFFYNPNISEESEYIKRFEELKRFVKEAEFCHNINCIDGGFSPDEFFEIAKGKEDLPERGARCFDCYKLRMEKTAKYGENCGYDYFTTTLSISPHKNAKWINEIGCDLANELDINFLFSDFKKKGGYIHSIELSKEYDLYRQDYCGCIFSRKNEKVETNNKNM